MSNSTRFPYRFARLPRAAAVLLLVAAAAGCKRKPPAPPPPPPAPAAAARVPEAAPPARPEIRSFTVNPEAVPQGQSAHLSWSASGADSAEITPYPGKTGTSGSIEVRPTESTLYTLRVTGSGGTATAAAKLTVVVPAPPPPEAKPASMSLSERLARDIRDIFFEYNRSDLGARGEAVLLENARALEKILEDFPGMEILLEGHCDERGSAEYNLGLGDRRSSSVRDGLGALGIPLERLRPVSMGKEQPQCSDPNEECWSRNRRVHFKAGTN